MSDEKTAQVGEKIDGAAAGGAMAGEKFDGVAADSAAADSVAAGGGAGNSNNLFVSWLLAQQALIEHAMLEGLPTASQHAPRSTERDLEQFLYDPLRAFIHDGGKRTRPALCLLGSLLPQKNGVANVSASADAGDADQRFVQVLDCACAFEDFQSAALIHDDIADQSEKRRGQPCMYHTQGTGVALNVGDLALISVIQRIVKSATIADDVKLKLIDLIATTEQLTIEGQALDLGWARDGRWDITEEDYLYMARHKTAYYSAAAPLVAGALCAGATQGQCESLQNFGLQAGLAFQLQDDLLNLIGDPNKQGKDWRSDITEAKRTLVVVRALTQFAQTSRTQAKRARLIELLDSNTADPDKLAEAVELLEEAGSIKYVQNYAHQLICQAKAQLTQAADAHGFNQNATDILLAMADFFIERVD